ncbi:MAG: hypothetical protein KC620_22275, partial [Myxococcales bacterium]|nr:hypothetical protein [Myxococcales bacterium]
MSSYARLVAAGLAVWALSACNDATDVAADAQTVDSAAADAAPDLAPAEDAAPMLDMAPPPEPDAAPPVEDAEPPPVVDAEPPPADMAPEVRCDPALSVVAEPRAARPYDLVTLRASGGTGQWRFEFVENASGGLLNEVTGAYLAGEVIGAVDEFRVTDTGCAGEARVSVPVVPGMTVRPTGVSIERGGHFTFAIEGGSGDFAFEMMRDFSGGEVGPDGTYTAGPDLAQDIVRVID